jgi:MFS family permease
METTAAKERIESELTIAHDVQMGRLIRGIPGTSLFFTIATLVMIGGLVTAAACCGLLPFCVSGRSFFALAGIFGLGWGIAMPLQAAVMFDISAPPARAMNQNLMVVMMQGGFFIGPFLGGELISRFGYVALFTSLAATALVAGG